MKFGPNLRKKITWLQELSKELVSILGYLIWLVFDPSKLKIIKTKNIKKILVVLVNSDKGNIGGDFCTLGVLNYFKRVYPHVSISILADNQTINQFGNVPGIEMISISKGDGLEKIISKNFDASLFLNLGWLSAKDFLFIPIRVSKSVASVGRIISTKDKLFLTRVVYNPISNHMVDLRFKMIEKLGYKFKKKDLEFYSTKEEEESVSEFLTKNKTKKFIVIHPGGKHMAETYKKGKCPPHLWPLDRYAKVASHFSKKGFSILVTGSKDESLFAEKIGSISGVKIINCCGMLSIRESGTLLRRAALLISTDTSIVHIAYQVGVPIVELMGPSIPEAVGAWPLKSKRHKILLDDGPFSRSMKKIECPEGIGCLDKISTKQVISSAEKQLRL